MIDVAVLAGVSVGTVSNVVNSPQRVSEATRDRVQVAIDKLGWVPSETARQLRAGRSHAVGLIVFDISNPFFTDVALGVEDALYRQGLSVYISNSDQRIEREEMLIRHFEQNRVRGVIMAPITNVNEHALQLRRRGIPVVMVDRSRDEDFCSVGVDDVEGGRLAAEHLLAMGHRRLAFVGGPMTLAQVHDRMTGARLAMDNHPDASLLTLTTPTLAVTPGTACATQIALMPDGTRPTAVFAANDLLAIGLLQGFVAAGLRVPDDIALIGYDDIEFAAAAAVPLSSVSQPRRALGERAAAMLVDEIAVAEEGGPHRHEIVRLAPVLVPRASTMVKS